MIQHNYHPAVDLADNIVRAAKSFERRAKHSAAKLGLNKLEADALLAVDSFDSPPTLGEVAKRLDAGSLPSKLLKDLRDAGVIDQSTDAGDERIRRYTVSESGKKLVRKLRADRTRVAKDWAKNIKKNEQEKISRLVGAITGDP